MHACVHVCMCLRFSDFMHACVRALCRVFGFFDDFFGVFCQEAYYLARAYNFLYNCVCMCSQQSIGPACVEGVKISYM